MPATEKEHKPARHDLQQGYQKKRDYITVRTVMLLCVLVFQGLLYKEKL
jgi:hypothetical protein